jgi:hypothetical protein
MESPAFFAFRNSTVTSNDLDLSLPGHPVMRVQFALNTMNLRCNADIYLFIYLFICLFIYLFYFILLIDSFFFPLLGFSLCLAFLNAIARCESTRCNYSSSSRIRAQRAMNLLISGASGAIG